MTMNKKIIFFALTVALVVTTAVMALWPRQAKDTGFLKKIALGVDSSDTFTAPVWIAESQGYFVDQGLDVKIVGYPSGRTALADMLAKKNLDVITCAQTPVMYNSFSNNNYAVIAGMSQSYDAGALLLARQDKGISIAPDLKGRRIGTPVGSSGHFFLNLFLIYSGLKDSEVEIIDIDAPSLPGALVDGRVDAIAVWQPQIYKAQKLLGDKAIILPSKDLYRVDFYLVSDLDFLKENADALKGFLKAIDRAEDFIMKNREKSIDIVSSRMKMDKQTITEIWDQYQFKIFLDQAIITDLEAEARWGIETKYANATRVPDYRKFIHPDILESLKPEAVNILN